MESAAWMLMPVSAVAADIAVAAAATLLLVSVA